MSGPSSIGAPGFVKTGISERRLYLGWFFIFFAPLLVPGQNISTPAYQLLNSRAGANRSEFYVYLDQDAGANHGFPSGKFGSIQTVDVGPGCVDDPAQSNGCSIDLNRIDRVRGTVMRVTFGAQTGSAGLNLEEPEKWSVNRTGIGYDLRGAVSVVFDVRSQAGPAFNVQFGVDGCTTPFMNIPSTWTTMTIPLASLGNCSRDFSDVHILFGIGTDIVNCPSGGTILLDNIRFEPVPTTQNAALGFPLASQTFGVVPVQNVPLPLDQVLRNVTTSYESSLAILLLLERGTPQDLANAREIADTFDYALHHDSHGDPLPKAPDGSLGAHNAHESGDIALFNDQPAPENGKAGDVRLAGFSASDVLCGPTKFCLVSDGATGGNNAFVILALVAAYEQFQDIRYLNDATFIGDWIISNLTDTTGRGYGGYYAGYPDMGLPKTLELGKSVENNADIFAAFQLMATANDQLGNIVLANQWRSAANVAGDFVMQMFDPVAGRFNSGTVPPGTTGAGLCPNGPTRGNDIINTCDFLDSNTFTTLAMATAPRYQNQIDWHRPIQYVLDHFAQTVRTTGQTFQGFDIVPVPLSGSANGVAWEFTGQVVSATRLLDQMYADTRFESSADFYLGQISNAQTMAPFGDGKGLVASTLQDGDLLPPLAQCLGTPFQCIFERVGLAATAWAITAENQENLFTSSTATFVNQLYVDLLGRQADPGGLSFWTSQINNNLETRGQAALGFFLAPEFQAASSLVTNCYLGILTRDPDMGGWLGWTSAVRSGLTPLGMVTAFLNSPEGQGLYSSLDNAAFVNAVYVNALHRLADSGGFTYWLDKLNSGALTRGSLMLSFIMSPEFNNLTGNRAIVDQLYMSLLRRQGENAGVAAWTSALNSGVPLNAIIGGFIASAEYRLRID